MPSIMRPAADEVSICCVTETKLTPCFSKSLERSAKSQRDRESRSILYTTTMLTRPATMSACSSRRPGRFTLPPE